MDEILIEEKKYVSSKRAAKMTGYAKDYIGQLCREGRVPARLIGRSWYVLEAAIQDHRFGNTGVETEKKENKTEVVQEESSLISTWESPRYDSSSDELLPPINRIVESSDSNNISDSQENIQDSWKAWFDRFDHSVIAEEPVVSDIQEEAEVKVEEVKSDEAKEEDINIPIHTVSRPIYHLPPEELLPRNVDEYIEVKPADNTNIKRKKSSRGIIMTIQMVGAVIALVTASLAVAGSGYFDEYIISSSQARMVAGVVLFNR